MIMNIIDLEWPVVCIEAAVRNGGTKIDYVGTKLALDPDHLYIFKLYHRWRTQESLETVFDFNKAPTVYVYEYIIS